MQYAISNISVPINVKQNSMQNITDRVATLYSKSQSTAVTERTVTAVFLEENTHWSKV